MPRLPRLSFLPNFRLQRNIAIPLTLKLLPKRNEALFERRVHELLAELACGNVFVGCTPAMVFQVGNDELFHEGVVQGLFGCFVPDESDRVVRWIGGGGIGGDGGRCFGFDVAVWEFFVRFETHHLEDVYPHCVL